MKKKYERPKSDIPVENNEAPAWMRVNEAAGVARVSVRTIRRAIWAGELEFSRLGRVHVIRRKWLFDWLESKSVKEVAR
jgi:excisionase family DNA binding protein